MKVALTVIAVIVIILTLGLCKAAGKDKGEY